MATCVTTCVSCPNCRLEENASLQGDAALAQFDKRLLRSTQAVLNSDLWRELVDGGGSLPPMLALESSNPSEEVGLQHKCKWYSAVTWALLQARCAACEDTRACWYMAHVHDAITFACQMCKCYHLGLQRLSHLHAGSAK